MSEVVYLVQSDREDKFCLKRFRKSFFGKTIVEFFNFEPNVEGSAHWVDKDHPFFISKCWTDQVTAYQTESRFRI